MLGTLVIGYIQLVMFAVLVFGLLFWLSKVISGKPVSVNGPAELWAEQQ
jgi:hypothetical protein